MKNRTISDFTENEYKQQAQNKNFTALANVMSGLNFSANKLVWYLYISKITKFQKIENIANATANATEYQGGSSNLCGVMVSNIKNYVTGINLSIIDSEGDTGKRLDKTPAAPRYTFARVHNNLYNLINPTDLEIVPRYFYEGKYVETQYMPFNLPMILINGNEGIGSGYAQKILPRNVDNIKKYIKEYLTKGTVKNTDKLLFPHFNNFNGDIIGLGNNQYKILGKVEKTSAFSTKITEVPNNFNYKSLIAHLDKLEDQGKIKSYTDLCDPKKDVFLVQVKHDNFSTKSEIEIIEHLGLSSTYTENLTVIDEKNRVKVFESPEDIIKHFIEQRLLLLEKRKDYLKSELLDDIAKNKSRYIFINAVVNDTLVINKRTKANIIEDISNLKGVVQIDDSFDYLLKMPVYSLTLEKMQDLKEFLLKLKEKLESLEAKTIQELWLDDISFIK